MNEWIRWRGRGWDGLPTMEGWVKAALYLNGDSLDEQRTRETKGCVAALSKCVIPKGGSHKMLE